MIGRAEVCLLLGVLGMVAPESTCLLAWQGLVGLAKRSAKVYERLWGRLGRR